MPETPEKIVHADELAKQFKEHSVAEFFKKNMQMLGLTGKIKTLTTIVHEYTTNSLDACEEAGILPEVEIQLEELGEEYIEVNAKDNGPGLGMSTVGKALGQLLAGTKFHRMIQARGQQGIGACMKSDTLVPMADGRILTIKEIVDKNRLGEEVISLDLNSMKLAPGKIVKCWKPKNPLFVKIKTSKGRVISLTPENPVLIINDTKPTWIRADEVQKGTKIAAPGKLFAFSQKKLTLDTFNHKTLQVENMELLDKIKKALLSKHGSFSKIEKETGIKKDRLRNWFNRKMKNGNPRGRPTLENLLKMTELAGIKKEQIIPQIKRIGRNGTFCNIPVYLDQETSWVAGLIAGDGHLSSTKDDKWGVNITFTNKNIELIEKYKSIIENKFGLKTQQYFHEEKKYYTVQCSSKIFSEILEFFGVTRGKKSDSFDLSNNLFSLDDELIAAYLKGLFDAEGSVSKTKNTIALVLYNKKAIEKIFFALLRLEIHASINKNGTENRISITQKSNIYKFYQKIGFTSKQKTTLLVELLSNKKTNTRTDTIPNINDFVKGYVKKNAPLTALSSASYSAVYNENISRNSLLQVLQTIGVKGKEGQYLNNLANGDTMWLEVISTEFEKNEEEFVYDLEIENYHNFVAGGIICHNSGCTMLSQITTGKPVKVITGTGKGSAISLEITIDPKKNEPVISDVVELKKEFRGLAIKARFKGVKYVNSEQGPLEYLRRTAVANPHAKITLIAPDKTTTTFNRSNKEIPKRPIEIKPHPKGANVDEIITLSKSTQAKKVSSFLKIEFDRVGDKAVEEITKGVSFDLEKDPKKLEWDEAEEIVKMFKKINFIAPRTDGLIPIGEDRIKKSLESIVQPEYLSVITRKPQVYKGGFPFLVEVGIAYGGNAGRLSTENTVKVDGEEGSPVRKIEIMRFANRAPLLFDTGACAISKAVQSIDWKRYGIKDFENTPLTIFVNLLSVHIPYTSAGKQAISDEDEIMEELRLALMDAGRKTGMYISSKLREQEKQNKRKIFMKYAKEVAIGLHELTKKPAAEIEKKLLGIVLHKLKLEEEMEAKGLPMPKEEDEEEPNQKKGKKKKKGAAFEGGGDE